MEKGKIILITIISLVVIGLIIISIFAYKYFNEESQKEKSYSIFKHFVVRDEITGNLTDGHYYYYKTLNTSQEIFIKQGDFIAGINEANLTLSEKVDSIIVYAVKEGHYIGRTQTLPEKDNIPVQLYKYPYQKDQIQVNNISLKKDLCNWVNISIKTDYYIQEPILCFAWSLGIITMEGERADIPNFLSKQVDECFKAQTINQEEKSFFFSVETGILNADDYLDMYIVDNCKLKYDDFNKYYDEYEEEDVCMETWNYESIY